MNKTHNGMAVFAYLWVLILIPFLTEAKNDPFVKFHLRQGLALIIFEVLTWFVGMFIGGLPVIGWLVTSILWLATIVFVIIGIMNAMNDREKELPLIGQYAKHFNF